MTHDELLIEINRRLDVAYYNGDPQSMRALRAVVELHKVILHKNYDTDIDRYECQVCKDVLYPCETIQAIEEELK
jgi:hypothetical protein